ncbi:hypothetical protein BY996DRAFT_4586628 [Phakopsora pachyrhizi]|nr:hypothetical protein BY996DRAFT_4586628 [Phakopsora pachyrhizi]
MSKFPKAPRFPPEKPSEVPGPGLYNPKLHDPLDDQWRKGLMGIFKAPRSKEEDHGPDTFGLYNPDQINDNFTGPSRPRAISTHATPSKHMKEILRLESKLNGCENKISTMTESLDIAEQTVKDTRRALQRSESENKSLHSEVDHLRQQMQKVSGLQHQVVQLQGEHEKSKSRREKEIQNLKSELRQAEGRATGYLSEKEELKRLIESLNNSIDAERSANLIRIKHTREFHEKYLHQMIKERDEINRQKKISEGLMRLRSIKDQRLMADRASQVSELVVMLDVATDREDGIYDVLDSLLETDDLVLKGSADDQLLVKSQFHFFKEDFQDLQNLLRTQQQCFDILLSEERTDNEMILQKEDLLQLELQTSETASASLQTNLIELTNLYSDLSKECAKKVEELRDASENIAIRDRKIIDLSGSICNLESELSQLRVNLCELEDTYSSKTFAWETQKSEFELSIRRAEQNLAIEQENRKKALTELMVVKQAEAALRSELNHAHNLAAHVEELEAEVGRMTKINDLLMRQSNLNAEEADKIAKLNAELVSQRNPAQRVRVLDRMRRELKEERENTAKLQNELWAAQSENASLKTELMAYQSISNPTSIPRIKSTTSFPSSSRIEGLSRVSRPVLKEVPFLDENTKTNTHYPTLTSNPPTRINDGNFLAMRSDIEPPPADSEAKPKLTSALPKPTVRAGRVPPKALPVSKLKRQKSVKQIVENTAEDVSLGAVKMQGKMTLEELR